MTSALLPSGSRKLIPAWFGLCVATLLPAQQPAVPATTKSPAAFAPVVTKLPEPLVFSPPVALPATPDEAAAVTTAVLGRPDWADRVAGETELLRQMTPENADAVLKAYQKENAKTRLNAFEMRLLHLRLGLVTGARHLPSFLPQQFNGDLKEPAADLVEGLGLRQPAEAFAWLITCPGWKCRPALGLAMTRSLSEADLAVAEAILEKGEGNLRAETWPGIFLRIVAFRGRSQAIGWGEKKLVSQPGDASRPGETWARRSLFIKIMEAVCATQDREGVKRFFAKHSLATYCSINEAQVLMANLGASDPADTFEWLPTVELAKEDRGCPLAIWTLNDTWINNDEPAVVRWIETKKDHPLWDYLVWTYATRLNFRGKSDEARKLMMTMKDSNLRTKALVLFEARPEAPKAP